MAFAPYVASVESVRNNKETPWIASGTILNHPIATRDLKQLCGTSRINKIQMNTSQRQRCAGTMVVKGSTKQQARCQEVIRHESAKRDSCVPFISQLPSSESKVVHVMWASECGLTCKGGRKGGMKLSTGSIWKLSFLRAPHSIWGTSSSVCYICCWTHGQKLVIQQLSTSECTDRPC
eukprot:752101-Amphidinium_carterae.1